MKRKRATEQSLRFMRGFAAITAVLWWPVAIDRVFFDSYSSFLLAALTLFAALMNTALFVGYSVRVRREARAAGAAV